MRQSDWVRPTGLVLGRPSGDGNGRFRFDLSMCAARNEQTGEPRCDDQTASTLDMGRDEVDAGGGFSGCSQGQVM